MPPAKKPQGPVALLEATHLACSHSLSRSPVGLRGPRALGHVFGKRFVFGAYRDEYRLLFGPKEKEPVSLYVCHAVRIGFEEENS